MIFMPVLASTPSFSMVFPAMSDFGLTLTILIFSSDSLIRLVMNGRFSGGTSRRSTISPAAWDMRSAADAICRMPESSRASSLVLAARRAFTRMAYFSSSISSSSSLTLDAMALLLYIRDAYARSTMTSDMSFISVRSSWTVMSSRSGRSSSAKEVAPLPGCDGDRDRHSLQFPSEKVRIGILSVRRWTG